MINLQNEVAVEVSHQKGQICNGTISQNKCSKKYIIIKKVHNF